MKKTKSLSDRLDVVFITREIEMNRQLLITAEDFDPTNWKQFVGTHEASIHAMAQRFAKVYKDDEQSLIMVAHVFGEQIGSALNDLKRCLERSNIRLHLSTMIRCQATIIVWKKQLEMILADIESEQTEEATDKPV